MLIDWQLMKEKKMPGVINKDLKHDIKMLEACEHLMATGRVQEAREKMNTLLMLKKMSVVVPKPKRKTKVSKK